MIKTAYISVIIIWSTTPLAVFLSSQSGVWFGVTSRMTIGLLTLLTIFIVTGQRLTLTKQAFSAYLAAGFGIYIAMSLVYFSAQYIPSGWISVIFGLSPMITAVLSFHILDEDHFNKAKLLGMSLGLFGLLFIFSSGQSLGNMAKIGVFTMLLSTIAHALSAVYLKKINAPISGIESTLGGLLIAAPLFAMTFYISGEQVTELSYTTIASILYLGFIATAIGFSLYYFILKNLDAMRVSLLTMVSPVCALMLGNLLNQEPINFSIIIGTVLIILGLSLFELRIGDHLRKCQEMTRLSSKAE